MQPCGGDTGVTCVHNTNTTAGAEHANSFCVFSGLNDMDPATGQTSKITQTPADGPAGTWPRVRSRAWCHRFLQGRRHPGTRRRRLERSATSTLNVDVRSWRT